MKVINSFCLSFVAVISTVVLMTACFDSSAGSARVTVNFGPVPVEDAGRAAAPSGVTGITLTVEADDMETVSETVPMETGSLTLYLPAGSSRYFSVIARGSGTITEYRGETTADLIAGEARDISLQMRVTDTKIVIPDFRSSGGRLVQIDDMDGNGWQVLDGDGILFSGTPLGAMPFKPYDTAIDNKGRIFIANNYGGSGDVNNCIIRIDNIAGDNAVRSSSTGYDYGPVALDFDEENNILYYCVNLSDVSVVYRVDPETFSEIDNFLVTNMPVRGISVEGESIYITHGQDVGQYVSRYDSAGNLLGQYGGDGSIMDNWDVLVKNDAVFMTNASGDAGHRILEFDRELTTLNGNIGTYNAAPTVVGEVMFPKVFVGKRRSGLYILDDHHSSDSEDRVLFMRDIEGNGWDSFRPGDIGELYFQLFQAGV